MTTVTFLYHHEIARGEHKGERTLEFEFDVAPVTPAKISGPPEDCYPEEGGECELQDVRCLSGAEVKFDTRFVQRKNANDFSYSSFPGMTEEWVITWPDGEVAVLDPEVLEESAFEQAAIDAEDYY